MAMEEEGPRPQNRFRPPVIDAWGVEDLRTYIAELQAEVARAEREITKREASKAAAAAFFRLGPQG